MLFLQGLHRARKRLQKYEEKSNLQNFSLRDPENTAERKKEAVWKVKGMPVKID